MIMIFVNGWVQRQRKFLPHCWRTSKPTWQPNTSFYTPNGNWWPALISSLLKLITSWRDYLTTVSLPVCHGWLHHDVTTWQPYPLLSAVVDYIMKWLLDNRIPSFLPWVITPCSAPVPGRPNRYFTSATLGYTTASPSTWAAILASFHLFYTWLHWRSES